MAKWTKKCNLWRFLLTSLLVIGVFAASVQAEEESVPSESQCRPYIEKALKDLESGDAHSASTEDKNASEEADVVVENDSKEDSDENDSRENMQSDDASVEENEDQPSLELVDEPYVNEAADNSLEAEAGADSKESAEETASGENEDNNSKEESDEKDGDSKEDNAEETQDENDGDSKETDEEVKEGDQSGENASNEEEDKQGESEGDDSKESGEVEQAESEDSKEGSDDSGEEATNDDDQQSTNDEDDNKSGEQEESDEKSASNEEDNDSKEQGEASAESDSKEEESQDKDTDGSSEEEGEVKSRQRREVDASKETETDKEESSEDAETDGDKESSEKESGEKTDAEGDGKDESTEEGVSKEESAEEAATEDSSVEEAEESTDSNEMPEDDLLMEIEIPDNLRSREHVSELLRLDEESTEAEILIEKSADIVLRELKRIYDTAIKPLEILYKYRDLSNRHFGDPEIFSKPLILFMGPWSGGKSSLINYLTDNEFTEWSLRTGAEPSPAYFNILMHGEEEQVLDGTQLAADWTFSGLQKFGQGLEERLRGLKIPNKLLEKVNIVEIPGILEVRKQVSRVFPFNDACQWFIDRADIIFLVYDPSKLDIGPETEAILDQLKGRESQTRIILNKADQVKPEELMRVQGALIWNISPLMSSAQPPVMYTTSLWSMPYESGAPVRLLQAQEKSFLKDLRTAIDRRVENKIASARRFAVRVRNHAKMVDCYLTTYYNHKTIFGNKKVVAEAIIEHPQNYHIYEGLSTLTNISRYDLPDPETYRDFFRLNPLYDFQQLSATCTYFRGCPINRLDIAIAYDLPELVGKYKKMVETATPQGMPKS